MPSGVPPPAADLLQHRHPAGPRHAVRDRRVAARRRGFVLLGTGFLTAFRGLMFLLAHRTPKAAMTAATAYSPTAA